MFLLTHIFYTLFSMEPTVFIGFLLAIALGGLIGTERELPWSGAKPGGATGF